MKVLNPRELHGEDSLLLTFEGAFDPQVALERELAPAIQAFEEYAGDWMPDVVKGKRHRRYSRAALWKGLEEERDENSTDVGLYRTKQPALDMTLRLRLPPRAPRLKFWLEVQPLSVFAEAESCRKFVDMVRAWASRYLVATYASAHSAADNEVAGAPRFGRDMQTSIRDGFDKVYEVSWLNVFDPKRVESVGR